MIKYEELPKKFRLKFGNDYYGYGEGEKTMITKYPSHVFKNDDFTEDSLIFAMIEKGVLEVVSVTVKKWVVFMYTDTNLKDKRYMAFIPEERKSCFVPYFKSKIPGVIIQYWDSFESIPSNLSVKKIEMYPTMFSFYAEEVEVDA